MEGGYSLDEFLDQFASVVRAVLEMALEVLAAVRVLVDEQLPRGLARELIAHDVSTVHRGGLGQVNNGDFLSRAEAASTHLSPPTGVFHFG
jgi:hypothetical protein